MKRALVAVGLFLVLISVAAVGAVASFLNGDAVKSRLVEQVRRSTGRDLRIAGPVTPSWSLSPIIALSDIALSNPPGFAQPTMAHVDRVEVQFALMPLFHREIEITRVALISPSIRLERDAAGRPNWDFRPPPNPAATPSSPTQPGGDRFKLAIGTVDITGATFAYGTQSITVPHAAYDPATARVEGSFDAGGTTLALSGTAGPFAAAPYPVDLHVRGDAATVALVGTSAAATLTVTAADLAALSPLVGRPLPPIRNITATAAFPGPTALNVHTGAIGFGALSIQHADLRAAALTSPATLTAAASAGALPLAITGHLGSIAGLLASPTPIDIRFDAPGLVGTAAGTISATGAGQGHLTVQSPDLAAAGVQAGLALPNLHDLNASADISVALGTTTLTGLHVTSAQGDVGGALTVTTGAPPTLRGTLTSSSLDLGALRVQPLPTPAPTATTPPAAVPMPAARLIPDTKLPVAMLAAVDADLQLTVDTLHWGAADLHAVQAHAVLQNGVLRLDPASLGVAAATARGTLELDAKPPALHVTIDAPGLPFGPISALAGGAPTAPGTLDLRADLAGTGDTVRSVAATLGGHAGLALVDAQLDNAVLERLAAGPLRAANVSLDGGGTTIRCAALRADAAGGKVDLRALTVDTSKFALEGGGDLSLADETLDLHLRPQLRLGGGLSVPVRVRGSFVAPKMALDPGAIASGRVGIVLGGAAPPDTCGAALALARDGRAGAPAAAPAPAKSMKPADLLRGLLR